MMTHRRALSHEEKARSSNGLIAELQALPGVEEVVIAVDEGVAYLKVDKAVFQS